MNNFRANRQQVTDAVMLFRDNAIVTEMLYPEFEAVLDNVVSMPDWAGQQARAAYVLISPGLQVQAVALFYLAFDENGTADPNWNLPLRQLVEKAGPGPDLGAGPIRLACRSQSPVDGLRMYLWDPEVTAEHNHLHEIRDAVKRNQLRLLTGKESQAPVAALGPDKLQRTAEEGRQLPASREHLDQLLQELQAEQDKNRTLQEQVHQLTSIAEQARHELQNLTVREKDQQATLGMEFEQKLQSQKDLLTSLHQEQLQSQQQQHRAQLAILQTRLDQLGKSSETAIREYRSALQVAQEVLQRLDAAGVALVAMLPGAGRVSIPVEEVDEFLKSPAAYAARHCMVGEEEYSVWLKHYEMPACDAHIAVTGELCGLPLERMTHPARFTPGISNRCPRHRELL